MNREVKGRIWVFIICIQKICGGYYVARIWVAKEMLFSFWRCPRQPGTEKFYTWVLAENNQTEPRNWRTFQRRQACQWSFGEIIGHWWSFCTLRESTLRLHHYFIWILRRTGTRSTLMNSATKSGFWNKIFTEERLQVMRKAQLYYNCFKCGHIAVGCLARSTCEVQDCKRRHHHPLPSRQTVERRARAVEQGTQVGSSMLLPSGRTNSTSAGGEEVPVEPLDGTDRIEVKRLSTVDRLNASRQSKMQDTGLTLKA